MAEDCEKCAERARMEEIHQSIEKNGNSCSLCSKKIEPDDRNKVVSSEYKKSLLKEDDREAFTAWYEAIARYSQQLRESLLSSESFVRRMLDIHKELHNLDLKKDNGTVVGKLQDMLNLAKMAGTDMKLIEQTLEQIEEKVHGNS